MMHFTLEQAVTACGGTFAGDPALLSRPLTGVSIDSRTVTRGGLYVPVIGEVYDGHRFIDGAMNNGALCTLTDRPLDREPYVLVSHTVAALQAIASAYRDLYPGIIIGVTGSVGKTSTKEMLYTVLSQHFSVYKTPGNLNNQTGVPQALFGLEERYEAAIIEMGTNHPGEIRALSAMAKPDICLLTNIGVAHIEFFGSRENILRGKAEMLEHAKPGAPVLVNGDDDLLITLPGITAFGFGENCDFRAENFTDGGLSGVSFTADVRGTACTFNIPVPGKHAVYNALAAIAVGTRLGMTAEELQRGTESYRNMPGRMDIRKTERFTVIDDTYNANPDSMRAAVDVMRTAEGRKVCVLGDMLELGERSPEFHAGIGSYAAAAGMDLLLCVGPLSAHMAAAAEAAGLPARCFENAEACIAGIGSILRDGDTVLLKASHGIRLDRVAAALTAEA